MKWIKKFFLISIIFFSGFIVASANESNNYTYTGVEMWGDDVETANTALINLSDENGNILSTYCMDYNTGILNKHQYSIMNVGDADYINHNNVDMIRNVVINAYPFVSLEEIINQSKIETLTEEEAIAGAQAAIWHYANGVDFELLGNVKTLYDYYLTLGNSNTSSTEISKLNIFSNTYFEEGIRNTLITVNNTNVFDLKFSFDKDLEKEYGVVLEETINGILIKNIPLDLEFEVTVSGKQNVNRDVYFFYPNGGTSISQSLVSVSSGIVQVSNREQIKEVGHNYKVMVHKKNSVSGESIEGVTFKLSNTSDFSEFVYEKITDENGIIVFDNIPNGTWYIKEMNVPDGYVLKEDVIKIQVQNDNVNVEVLNDPFGKIKIVKANVFGDRLSNVSFDLYKEEVNESNLIKRNIVTDENGEAVIENLNKGKYILVETKTKDGYVLNTDGTNVNVEYGKTNEIKIINKTLGVGKLVIRKLDSENNKLLKGASIGIYQDKACKDLFLEIKTTDQEQVINNIPTGKYCIKEIVAPEGYILNIDEHFVEIIKDETAHLEILNHKIYNTASNHYVIFVFGMILFLLAMILYLGHRLWLKRR